MNENKQSNIYSILGLIFGCLSIVSIGNFLLGILGIIFSSIAKKDNNEDVKAKIGFTLSIISLIITLVIVIIFALLLIYRVIFIQFD